MTYRTGGLLALGMFLPWGTAAGQQLFGDGFEESCLIDADNDRLSNCEEAIRGLNYFDNDTDGDGLADGDEVLGTVGGLNLPAFGVNPRHKDFLVEIDWTDESFECDQHSHRPNDLVIGEVKTFYSLLPIPNPDGKSGINYIADYGQGGAFTGGNFVETGDGVVTFTELTETYWPVEFAVNRRGYFRYSMHAHRWDYNEGSSGIAQYDYNLVTLYCYWDKDDFIRNTMVHEYGHNFGLGHGGDTYCNNKPNYNSSMNYNHTWDGVDTDCDGLGNGIDLIGYSEGTRPPIDESAIIEANGVCGPNHPLAKPVDLNHNGIIDAQPVAHELSCEESTGIITDWNDVAALVLKPNFPVPGGGPIPPDVTGPESDPCPSLPFP